MWDTVNCTTSVLIVLLILLYLYRRKKYSRYDGTEIHFDRPWLPFLGSFNKVTLCMESGVEMFTRNYFSIPDDRYVGLYEFERPVLLLKDLNMIKDVCVRDFEHFTDRENVVHNKLDGLFRNSLFALKGKKWRDMRNALSPAFTGSKIRNMFEYVEECTGDMIEFYTNSVENSDKSIEIDLKNEFSKLTSDVIASVAYGIKLNTFKDKNNEFYHLGKSVMNTGWTYMLKLFGFSIAPTVMQALNISFIDRRATEFFREIVSTAMEARNNNKDVNRNDMIKLLMEAKQGSLNHDVDSNGASNNNFPTVQEPQVKDAVKQVWTDDELTAQAFIFFMGGYDTVSTSLSFFFYEMAINPSVQSKLQSEIDGFKSQSDKLIYDELHKLKYLDLCISETLRKWPPITAVNRACTKPYLIPPPFEKTNLFYRMKVGETIVIPIYSIHRDPKYYPNPDKFDPERFSEANRSKIEPYAYLPFGIGPRNCIGSRFALMEMKIIIYHTLSKFDFVPVENTQIRVKFDKGSFHIAPKNGLHVGIKPRV